MREGARPPATRGRTCTSMCVRLCARDDGCAGLCMFWISMNRKGERDSALRMNHCRASTVARLSEPRCRARWSPAAGPAGTGGRWHGGTGGSSRINLGEARISAKRNGAMCDSAGLHKQSGRRSGWPICQTTTQMEANYSALNYSRPDGDYLGV